jgi:DNA-binding LacI/PurR family transcriptional regulator
LRRIRYNVILVPVQPRRSTLKDVAKSAGVSFGMAGRVLGNYGSFSEETRRKVILAARSLRYTPNTIARSLRTRLTRTIGVLVSDITTSFWTSLVRGIQDRAAKEAFSVILCNSDEESRSEKEFLSALIERSIDGLIISPTQGNHVFLKRLARGLMPVVLVDRGVPGLCVPTVSVDNEGGAYQAVQYLIGRGHRSIAIIKGIDGVETSDARFAGYKRALSENGLPMQQSFVKEGRFLRERAAAVTGELLCMKKGPTAIFVCNEAMLSGAVIAVKESNVRVPRDLSLVGFDDPDWAAYVDPPLTAVSQPSYAMGMLAFDYLMARITKSKKKADGAENVVLAPTLMVRKSCGPARGSHIP